ncbi:MAG: ATP-binding protein [Planctomycetota bacterium]|nr:ATP-binding protein [Planctomycetota bacterium]
MTHPANDQSMPPSTGHVGQQIDGLERHLASMQEQVQRLQRLASVGTVSAMLAHEINNIMTPIVSYTQYALERDDADLMRTASEKTLRQAKRLTGLCERVLGLATDDQMGPIDTFIRPLAVDAVECLGRDLDSDNIELLIEIPEDLKARVHASSLQQVLFNLVLNARQAMLGRRGRLVISARREKDGGVEISVADSGTGIRPDDIRRIFEPFYSTKVHQAQSDKRGIGLGLTICQQLVEEQAGTIAVESVYGAGTTFTLTLPAAECD